MTTPITQPLQTDRDGRPVAQFWNPQTLMYEIVRGAEGRQFVAFVHQRFLETAAALGIDGIFDGSASDFGLVHMVGHFRAASTADQSGTLFIEQSDNGTAWIMTHSAPTTLVPDAAGVNRHIARIDAEVYGRFVRVRYRNGAVAQTTLRIISMWVGG